MKIIDWFSISFPQNLKNQIMTTNVWVEQVSKSNEFFCAKSNTSQTFDNKRQILREKFCVQAKACIQKQTNGKFGLYLFISFSSFCQSLTIKFRIVSGIRLFEQKKRKYVFWIVCAKLLESW
jgi:hypothetical protein